MAHKNAHLSKSKKQDQGKAASPAAQLGSR